MADNRAELRADRLKSEREAELLAALDACRAELAQMEAEYLCLKHDNTQTQAKLRELDGLLAQAWGRGSVQECILLGREDAQAIESALNLSIHYLLSTPLEGALDVVRRDQEGLARLRAAMGEQA